MTAVLCLYFGTPGECQNCGGSTKAVDPDTKRPGPFEGDERYCSEECFVEAQEFMERDRQRTPFFCEACGTDDDSEHFAPCVTTEAASG